MKDFIAALPMYDWPECRRVVDAQWAAIRDRLRAAGVGAPEQLVRRNGDMPAVPGGIRDAAGRRVAPDPATLPPDELDLPTLWRHPKLLFAQCCWGPIETTGLGEFVTVVGQPDYSDVEGGEGQFYRSALLMRRRDVSEDASLAGQASHLAPDGHAAVPADLLRGRRFAFNSEESMSGILALTRDLEVEGEGLAIFSGRIETGGHRASIRAVADGRADVCAIDCRSWAMAKRYEPAALALDVVGWTKRRRGLPFVSASGLGHVHDRIRDTLAGMRDGA